MTLHVEVSGAGDPLVMLHGWGMHGRIWDAAAARLAEGCEVHNVDLPGHGASAAPDAFTVDSVVDQLARRFARPVTVLGWSLGGILALHWAQRASQQVKRLVLVASTPCFAERVDWTWGMPASTLAEFAAQLEQDHGATLRRFLSLQVRGVDGEREQLAALRKALGRRAGPDLRALRGGLDILRDADLRGHLVHIAQPTLAIAGGRDRLTPARASYRLAEAMPNARVVEIEGAAHAPFLSHPEIFIEHVKNFLHERI